MARILTEPEIKQRRTNRVKIYSNFAHSNRDCRVGFADFLGRVDRNTHGFITMKYLEDDATDN